MIERSPSSLLLGCAVALTFSLTNLRDAEACGGCFHPAPTVIVSGTETSSVVTDHRMVFKISSQETILWDQVRYTGAPEEFAWVLPVREGATVELSHDEFIASLDAMTKTTVKGPTRVCRDPNSNQTTTFGADGDEGGGGCGSSMSDLSYASAPAPRDAGATFADAGGDDDKVDVVSQAVIGPYQSVTLHAKNGEGIADWLETNKFQIPDNVKPTIEAYTREGFDFIALRLRPGQGVQAMRPVRVVSQGADMTLPLRMVAAGIGAKVGLTLWIIGEGRYEAQNFPNGVIDDGALRWDAKLGKSNLSALQQDIFAESGGRTWLTEGAGSQRLEGSISELYYNSPTVYSTYMRSCIARAPREVPCNAHELPGSTADGGASDAGDAGSPSTCMKLVSACEDYDDLEVAGRGLRGLTYVTRLRADLPATALSDDLHLTASSQRDLLATHAASSYLDPNDDPCPDGVYRGSSSSSSSSGASAAPAPADDSSCTCRVRAEKKPQPGTWLLIGVTAFAVARLKRRRR